MKAQNLHKLSDEAKGLIRLLMDDPNYWWPSSYMVEVRLDDPINHLLDGGEGLHKHAGNGSRHYAHHYNDEDWAVIHEEDEDWTILNHDELREIAKQYLETL